MPLGLPSGIPVLQTSKAITRIGPTQHAHPMHERTSDMVWLLHHREEKAGSIQHVILKHADRFFGQFMIAKP